MACMDGIKKGLEKNNIEADVISKITDKNLIYAVEQMEKSLDADTLHRILDSCACGSEEDEENCNKEINNKFASKTLIEILEPIINQLSDYEKIVINPDNTFSVTWSFLENGKYKCQCPVIVDRNMKVSDIAAENEETHNYIMPLSYCICCAVSCRRYFYPKINVELRTKEIVSSPINSKGEKPCCFVFEVVG